MVSKKDHLKSVENLIYLIGIQMIGFVVLEVIVWLLIAVGIIPPMLVLKYENGLLLQINAAYIVIAGLMSLLVAGFWLAILTEVFGIIEVSKVKLKL